jgi:D-glycero-D-manno-heptose 1,7-bisphosphate phosphatase
MTRAIFLDRDGVINRKPPEGQYVTSWEDFHILPGVVEAIGQLNRAGFSVIVVTNQRCIAKGLLTVAELNQMHKRMSDSLARAGATISGIYYCPHEMEPTCYCRKPAPGMLLDAARSHDIELASSWMLGDSDIDVETGRNAGCKAARLLVTNGPGDSTGHTSDRLSAPDVSATSLLDAVRKILIREGFAVASFTKVSE